MEPLWGRSREGERMLSQHLFATCHTERSDWGHHCPYTLQVLLLPSPAASSHSPVVPALRDHVPSHSQHQELGVTPVLQVLINEPSLGSVRLPSPWNRILLARLPLHRTAAFFFALHLQISARTTISKQICSELMAGLEIWKNPWQIFASLHRKPRGYFS